MSFSNPAKLGIGALALIGAFLLGYAPASLDARGARAAQETLTHKLAVATLQVQLGMISNEVNRDNYGLAAQMATPFFDGVRPVIAATDPADQEIAEALRTVLARRDEITSDLAQANPQIKSKLADLCADLYRVTQAP